MTPETDLNPYAAPAVQMQAEVTESPSTFFQKPLVIQAAWLLAVLINLPVPVMFGHSAVEAGAAEVGLLIGIAAVYFTGVWCCTQQAGVMWRLIVGSAFTAVSQFMPVAHMIIGLIAMGISRAIFDPGRTTDNITNLPEVVSATVLTGLGLIALSIAVGFVLIVVLRLKTFDSRTKPDSV